MTSVARTQPTNPSSTRRCRKRRRRDEVEREDINQPTQPDAIVPDVESTTASQETETADKGEAVVPMVRAYLIDSVRIAPHQSVVVPVQLRKNTMLRSSCSSKSTVIQTHTAPRQTTFSFTPTPTDEAMLL